VSSEFGSFDFALALARAVGGKGKCANVGRQRILNFFVR